MAKKGSEFHVTLDGVKFSAAAEKRIQAGIQSLVMSELVGYKPDPDAPSGGGIPGIIGGGRIIIRIPKKWPGLIAMKLPDKLTDITGKQIDEMMNQLG